MIKPDLSFGTTRNPDSIKRGFTNPVQSFLKSHPLWVTLHKLRIPFRFKFFFNEARIVEIWMKFFISPIIFKAQKLQTSFWKCECYCHVSWDTLHLSGKILKWIYIVISYLSVVSQNFATVVFWSTRHRFCTFVKQIDAK